MKALKEFLEKFSFLNAMLFLFESCKVYHKDLVTLQQAFESGKQIKFETNSNQTFRFQKVLFDYGQYYGELKDKNQYSRVPITENTVLKVQLHNRTLSNIYSVAVPIATVVGTVTTVLFLKYKKSQEELSGIFDSY